MAKKRLSLEQVNYMKQMVQKGVAPEDIAKHFGVAISSVHNYKARFKAEGVRFPSVRGKRPTGSVDVKPSAPVSGTQVSAVSSVKNNNQQTDAYKFIVNGTAVQISGHAKNISIDKDSMEINF